MSKSNFFLSFPTFYLWKYLWFPWLLENVKIWMMMAYTHPRTSYSSFWMLNSQFSVVLLGLPLHWFMFVLLFSPNSELYLSSLLYNFSFFSCYWILWVYNNMHSTLTHFIISEIYNNVSFHKELVLSVGEIFYTFYQRFSFLSGFIDGILYWYMSFNKSVGTG